MVRNFRVVAATSAIAAGAALALMAIPGSVVAASPAPPVHIAHAPQPGTRGARTRHGRRRPHDAMACDPSDLDTFIGAGSSNYAGGENSGVMVGTENGACDIGDAIAGGYENVVGGNGNAPDGFIGGGFSNYINNSSASADYSTIGAGESNGIVTNHAGIGAGFGNVISGAYSFVASGYTNKAAGLFSFIGAGEDNTVALGYAAVVAGIGNSASGYDSLVGAGYKNLAAGSGAFVGGGGYEVYLKNASFGNRAVGIDSFVGAGDANVASGVESFAGGGLGNTSSSGGTFVGAGFSNTASTGYAFVGAGGKNVASNYDDFVGAGYANTNNGAGSFIGAGGYQYYKTTAAIPNSISANGIDSFIGAGDGNTANSIEAFIGGGQYNTIAAPTGLATAGGAFGAITGGFENSIVSYNGNNVEYGFIGGGYSNTILGSYAVIGGGYTNKATGVDATVPGGVSNLAAGTASFAAGSGSDAATAGSFVWSDDASSPVQLRSTVANQFLVRSSGGIRLYSSADLTSGVSLAPGSGAWASLSDRAMKTRIAPIDDDAILQNVARLPVSKWSYRSENPLVRHVGPMAQDFYARFGVGEDNRHITSIDEDGVALAAIKALVARDNALAARDSVLEDRVATLTADVRRLTHRRDR